MKDRQFWDIIERSLASSRGSSERQAAELEEILAALPPAQIASFDASFTAKTDALYSWEIWGAVYVLLEYCADDCFEYFRNWVVGQGRDYYAAVSLDPLALGDGRLANDAEAGDAELLDYASVDAYARASGGRDLYEDYPDNPASATGSEPAGTRSWDEENVADFYPDLEPIPLARSR